MLLLWFGGYPSARSTAPTLTIFYFIPPTRHQMKKIIIIAFTFLFSLMSRHLFACTIFYAARGNMVLAGNYEEE